jgi:hypothetical protein
MGKIVSRILRYFAYTAPSVSSDRNAVVVVIILQLWTFNIKKYIVGFLFMDVVRY